MTATMKKIGEVADVKGGKRLPKGQSILDCKTEHPYLRVVDFSDGGVDRSNVKYIDNDVFQQISRYTIDSKDVYISIAGTIGRVGIVPDDLSGANLTENAAKITNISENVDHRYLKFFLQSPMGQGAIRNRTVGTSQPKLALHRIADIDFPYRPLIAQRAIANILCAYDDLIENNRRRIKLLEEAARLIYREWFVHLRFPGHDVSGSVDGIPIGWQRNHLQQIADVTMGQSPKSIFYNEDGDGLPFHQGVTDYGSRFPTTRKYCTVQKRIAEEGDILFSVRAPVGRINIAGTKLIIGRGLAAICATKVPQSFLFYALREIFFKDDLIGAGAIYASITKKDLLEVEVLIPTPGVLDEFSALVEPIDNQVATLSSMNLKLARARDMLLPRLMSGELAV